MCSLPTYSFIKVNANTLQLGYISDSGVNVREDASVNSKSLAKVSNFNVTVIDKNPNIVEDIVNRYDVMGICGNGASYSILRSAEVGRASLVIAVTASDETNILACCIAKKLGAKATIARVRDYEYNQNINRIKTDFEIDMTINPEKEAADEIVKILDNSKVVHVGMIDGDEPYVPAEYEGGDGMYYQLKYMLELTETGKKNEISTPEGAAETIRIVEAAHKSADMRGERVAL